jgi:hypothetical protein
MEEMDRESMDKAAELAKGELELLVGEGKISADQLALVSDWLKRNYLKAGYKRLARILIRG